MCVFEIKISDLLLSGVQFGTCSEFYGRLVIRIFSVHVFLHSKTKLSEIVECHAYIILCLRATNE